MEKVKEILSDLEKKHDIKIIYSVEAGSRAWGLESEDSDYDIRFVYIHNDSRKYLSLKPITETIDSFSEDRIYDWQGWDITKALKHISQMNPSIVEWIYSPIIYFKDDSKYNFQEKSKKLLLENKRILPLLHHYRSMAKSNYKSHIQNNIQVKIKKYLYVIRPVGMVEWLLNCKSKYMDRLIDIDFNKVLSDLKPYLSIEVYENIIKIIELKKNVKELDLKPRLECIDNWIENILNYSNDKFKSIENLEQNDKKNLDDYDLFLHEILDIKFNN